MYFDSGKLNKRITFISYSETENEIGGLSKTLTYNNNKVDIGPHRFFSKEKQVIDLWNNLLQVRRQDQRDLKK